MSDAKHTEWTVHGALYALEQDIWRHYDERMGQVHALEFMLQDLNGLHRELAQLRVWWQDESENLRAWGRAVRAVRANLLEQLPPRGHA
jgi:hypothetical protein